MSGHATHVIDDLKRQKKQRKNGKDAVPIYICPDCGSSRIQSNGKFKCVKEVCPASGTGDAVVA